MKKGTRNNRENKFEVNKSFLTVRTYRVTAKNKAESIKKVKLGKGRFIDVVNLDTEYESYKL